ncbi:nucleotidyl transferase AbiEii/AbiGii toxin family protein, partial [Candidatus Bipolaricaulota bacterium]|nr:nucleotidyl transferase AbiEii/AbiGii toxin family protein [Candidatus Bipolaricaulota bacterium]
MDKDYEIENPWFSGEAQVSTFQLDELMGSKLRALFQRRKGRDLFDLWFTLTREMVEPSRILSCFERYTSSLDTPITRARFEENLSRKLDNTT